MRRFQRRNLVATVKHRRSASSLRATSLASIITASAGLLKMRTPRIPVLEILGHVPSEWQSWNVQVSLPQLTILQERLTLLQTWPNVMPNWLPARELHGETAMTLSLHLTGLLRRDSAWTTSKCSVFVETSLNESAMLGYAMLGYAMLCYATRLPNTLSPKLFCRHCCRP